MEKDTFEKIKEIIDDILDQVLTETLGEMNIKVDKDGTEISWTGNKQGLVAAANGAIEAVMNGKDIDFDEAVRVIKGYRAVASPKIHEADKKVFCSKEEYEVYKEMEKKSPEERDALKKQLDK